MRSKVVGLNPEFFDMYGNLRPGVRKIRYAWYAPHA